jgi:polyribonucleotide nucleotidyltransferase
MIIIKVKKGLRKNIMGSLLWGSFIAATTPAQATLRFISLAEQKRQEACENEKRAAEAAAKMTGRTKEEGKKVLERLANMTPEEREKENQQKEKKKKDKYWKHIKFLRGR